MTDKQIKQTTSPGDFIFHAQWMPIFRSFPPEMAARIIHAVIDYLENGVLPDDPQLKALCTFLFAHIDADRQHIEEAAPAAARKKAKKQEPAAKTPSQESTDESSAQPSAHAASHPTDKYHAAATPLYPPSHKTHETSLPGSRQHQQHEQNIPNIALNDKRKIVRTV